MSLHPFTSAKDRAFVALGGINAILIGQVDQVVGTLWHWHELARQRRQLRALDDRLLGDMGLSRADVEREGRRWFWQE
ncbi:MAG: DUF1127 domain-containing protein [Candidatus Competibacterales bacterium]